jgi:hypothetical protein
MNKTFEQKRGSNLRKHTLKTDRILVETTSLRKNEKFEIMLDSLGSDISYKADSTIIGKVFFFICLAIPIAMTVALLAGSEIDRGTLIVNYVIWFGLAIFNFLKQSQDDVFLVGGQKYLVFYRAIPNEKEVLEYINEIIVASKAYIREKYAKVDPDIPHDMFFARLLWLKEKGIINESEYREMKNEYDLKKLI